MQRLATLGAALTLASAAYYYFSPHLALHDLRTAIADSDVAALDERVDFPHLRESLKAQFNAMMLKETAADLGDNPFGALALGLASKLVDGMVDAFVTPAGLATLAQGERPHADPLEPRTASASEPPARSEDLFADARITRDSLSRFSMWVPDDNGNETQFVFRRSGLTWRLTDIFLPLQES